MSDLNSSELFRSASSQESISARYSPSAGAGRHSGRLRAGGSGDSNAWRTVRRCTR